jgi:hypothetical protein
MPTIERCSSFSAASEKSCVNHDWGTTWSASTGHVDTGCASSAVKTSLKLRRSGVAVGQRRQVPLGRHGLEERGVLVGRVHDSARLDVGGDHDHRHVLLSFSGDLRL